MDPTLLLSSVFILFFFGFNSDTFIGTEDTSFTAQALLERAAKSICGTTMVYGLSHFAGIILEQYKTETPQIEENDISPAATITAAATPDDGTNQLDDNASDETPTTDDNQWDQLRYGSRPSPNPSKPLYMPRGMDASSTYPNHTLLRPAVKGAGRHENLNIYLTKYDFVVFVCCVVLPGLILWSMRRPKKKGPTQTQEATPDSRPISNYLHGGPGDNTGDLPFAHNVFSAYSQTPQVPEQPLVTKKLDEILAFARVAGAKADTPSQSGTASATEFESLRKILDTVISDSKSQAQDLELLNRGQQRIERHLSDSKTVEEAVEKYLKDNLYGLGCSCPKDGNTKDLQERIEMLEQSNSDLVDLIEKIQLDYLSTDETTKELETRMNHYSKFIAAMNEGVDSAQHKMDNRLGKLEQTQNAMSVLMTSSRNLGKAQKQAPISSELKNTLDNLERQVGELQREAPMSNDSETKYEDLNKRVAYLQKSEMLWSKWARRLPELEANVAQNRDLLNGSVQQTLKTQGKDISTLNRKVSKIESERQDMDKPQQAMHTYEKDIDSLKEKIGKIESERQDTDKLQQSMHTYEKDIESLKDKVGKIESERQDMDKPQQSMHTYEEDIDSMKTKIAKIESERQEMGQLQQSMNTSAKDFDSLKEKVNKIESERHDVGKIQQTLHTHDQAIGSLKKEIDRVEIQQRDIGTRGFQVSSEQSSAMGTIRKHLNRLENDVNDYIEEKADAEEELKKDMTEFRFRLDLVEDSSEELTEKYNDISSRLTAQEEMNKKMTEMRFQLALLEDSSREHAENYWSISSQLTAQEERQLDAEVQNLTNRLAKITETLETLQNLRGQETERMDDFNQAFIDIDKETKRINIDLLNLKMEVFDKALYDEDPIEASANPIHHRVSKIETNIAYLLGIVGWTENELDQAIAKLDQITDASARQQALQNMTFNVSERPQTLQQLPDAPANVSGQPPVLTQPNNPPEFKSNSDDPYLAETMDYDATDPYYTSSSQPPEIVMNEDLANGTFADMNDEPFQPMDTDPVQPSSYIPNVFDVEFGGEPLQENATNSTVPSGYPPNSEQPANSSPHESSHRQEEMQPSASLSQSRWASPEQPTDVQQDEKPEKVQLGASLSQSRWASAEQPTNPSPDESSDQQEEMQSGAPLSQSQWASAEQPANLQQDKKPKAIKVSHSHTESSSSNAGPREAAKLGAPLSQSRWASTEQPANLQQDKKPKAIKDSHSHIESSSLNAGPREAAKLGAALSQSRWAIPEQPANVQQDEKPEEVQSGASLSQSQWASPEQPAGPQQDEMPEAIQDGNLHIDGSSSNAGPQEAAEPNAPLSQSRLAGNDDDDEKNEMEFGTLSELFE